jgi:hypothetical protein
MPSGNEDASEIMRRGWFWSLAMWGGGALALYFLSVGPVARLTARQLVPLSAMNAIYAPLGWMYEKTPLHKPIGIYLHLWMPDEFDAKGDVTKYF